MFWASLFCVWTFSTLLGFVVLPRNREDLDILKVVVIALYVSGASTNGSQSHSSRSGFFGSFTFVMVGTHTRLILLNVTTVEQMKVRDMKEDESAMLAEKYSMFAFSKKRKVRARWDEEWGRPAIEGNIWWLGSMRENWKSVMGQSVWSWFCEFHGMIVLAPPN